jgi:hypothetical protein
VNSLANPTLPVFISKSVAVFTPLVSDEAARSLGTTAQDAVVAETLQALQVQSSTYLKPGVVEAEKPTPPALKSETILIPA